VDSFKRAKKVKNLKGLQVVKSKCQPKTSCEIAKADLFRIFQDHKPMLKQMQKSNFIFKTAWNFLAKIKSNKVRYGLNLLWDFEKQISDFLEGVQIQVAEKNLLIKGLSKSNKQI
jgi:hypothetical protein